MCRKASSSHSKTLGMDAVLPNHPALGATLTPLSARASGFRGTVVPLSQPKTTVNNIVLGVVTAGGRCETGSTSAAMIVSIDEENAANKASFRQLPNRTHRNRAASFGWLLR